MTEDEMVGWHHQLDGHESEKAQGVGDGQGILACYSPRGRKELDMTERLDCSRTVTWIQLRYREFPSPQIRSDQSLSRVRLFATP